LDFDDANRIEIDINDIDNAIDVVDRSFDSANDRLQLIGFDNVNLTFTTSNGDSSLLADGQVFITYEDLEANSLSDFGL
jgi:hypothetical protein